MLILALSVRSVSVKYRTLKLERYVTLQTCIHIHYTHVYLKKVCKLTP